MGWSLIGIRPLKASADIPRDPLFATRASTVDDQYGPEVRVKGQPRFRKQDRRAGVDPRFGGDNSRTDTYACFARDDLLKAGLDPDSLLGAKITGFMRRDASNQEVWVPTELEVFDDPARGHLPRVGPILLKLYLRPLKDLRGGP